MAIKQWLGNVGSWDNPAFWSGGVPVSGDIAVIPGGSVAVVRGESLDGVSVLLTRASTQTTDLVFQNAVLGSTSSVVGDETGGPVTVTLANSVMNGIIGSALGQTNINILGYGVNLGAVSVGDSVGTASVFIDANQGQFYNFGMLYAETNAAIVASFGKAQVPPGPPQPTFNGPQQVFTNAGTAEATSGGQIYFQGNFGGAPPGTINSGIIANTGTIDANGGTITIASDITQAGGGIVKAENGGTINLLGAEPDNSGTYAINDATLNFGVLSRYHNGSVAALEFHSTVLLDGTTASLGFGTSPEGPMTISFDEMKQELLVNAPQQIGGSTTVADIHVIRSASHLTANEFTVSGSNVLFHNNA